jgi:hypothetical protein
VLAGMQAAKGDTRRRKPEVQDAGNVVRPFLWHSPMTHRCSPIYVSTCWNRPARCRRSRDSSTVGNAPIPYFSGSSCASVAGPDATPPPIAQAMPASCAGAGNACLLRRRRAYESAFARRRMAPKVGSESGFTR